LKVLIVSSLYAPHIGGGAEIILKEHVRALTQKGVEVVVLSIGPQAGLIEEEVDGVRVWRAGIKNLYFHHGTVRPRSWQRTLWHALDVYNPFMKSFVRRIVELERPDLASCHNITGWSVSVWDALSESGVPIVQVLHDQYLLCPKSTMFRDKTPCRRQCFSCRLMRLAHSAKSNQVQAVVGVSQFVLDKLLSYGYFQRTPVREYIHNSRQFSFDTAALAPRTDDGTVVFGFIGTLAPNKGVELLLETFCGRTARNWRLLIAGTGKADYEAMLRDRFNDPCISYLGHCDPKDFFTRVDATVVPSLWEDTFPGVVFESMLFGVPVVGSRRGGIPEMIIPGESGLLFDPDRANSLLETLQRLADVLPLFRESRDAIIEQAGRFSNPDLWTEKWLKVFHQVVLLNEPDSE
jgi:glycosyltransferase involved in cell wall biosynthesis